MTASNTYVSEYYYHAENNNLDADELLRRAGLEPAIIDSPDTRVPTEKLAKLALSTWDQLDDENMGLAGSRIPRGAFYMMGKLAVGELSLCRALLSGIEFYRMATDAYLVSLVEDNDYVTLRFDMQFPQQDRHFLLAEIISLAWHRIASWLIAENILLHEVYFDYAAPSHVQEYAYLFPGQHILDAEFLGFSFSKKFLDREICQTRETLRAFIKNCPMQLLMQPKQDFTVSGDLKRVLRKQVAEGFPRLEEAAESLHMTKRTMMRKLKEEGTSYQELKDLVRRDRAVYLLKTHQMPVSKVAEEVGFSDPAVFARSFKNWTGMSPSDYRSVAD